MIVDGRAQFDGSDSGQARLAISLAAHAAKADVEVVESGPETLSVHVGHLPASARNDPAEIVLAVTEDGLTSSVGGGEVIFAP